MKNILRKIKPAANQVAVDYFHPWFCKYDWCANHAFGLPQWSGNDYK